MMMGLDSKRPDAKSNICDTASAAPSNFAEQATVDASLHREITVLIPALRRYARALQRDFVAADDLVQDCLCRALAKIHLWQRGTNLRVWLFTILHNQHVSEARRVMRRGIGVAVEDAAPPLAVAADALSLMQLRDLQRAIDCLPEAQRQAILLVGLDGMEYEDAAAVLGIPAGTLRSRLFRARARLRELTEEDDAAPRPYARQQAAASAARLAIQ
jgi:RNA polymerase sigma-70 factor, ECF subfamily